MRTLGIAALLLVGFCFLTFQVKAQEQLTVSPTMDIFKAGGYNDGSNGESPTVYSFTPGGGRILAFSSVVGSWDCNYGGAYYGPDGTQTICGNFSIPGPIGPFSGFNQTDFVGAMVGMFLRESLPASAPPTLRFYVRDYSQGGIPTSFRFIAPEVGQVFFIGNGRTGSGHFQLFAVPSTATRLYLGYVDTCVEVNDATPGCYSDNSGGMVATFKLYDTVTSN